MINPISPEFVRVIHDEKIRAVEREIEMMRTAKAQRAYYETSAETSLFARASHWVKETFTRPAPVRKPARQTARKGVEVFEEPCRGSGVPC